MEYNNCNILVTGGSGFIGSNFIRWIYNHYPSYRIFNLDALTYAGNPENLFDIERQEIAKRPEEKRYHFINGDVCDGTLLDAIFHANDFAFVVHFAAETHVDRSLMNAAHFIRTNIEGTRSLMECIHQHKTPRFVHISTDEVYGSIENGFSDEQAPLRPSNPYSTSKAGADLLVQSYAKTYEIPALIVRGSNNYGPYQYPEKLIPMSISNLMEGKKIPLHGSGNHVRSWLHVNDFCSAIDTVMHKGQERGIYNVSGEQMSNLEIVNLVAQYVGKDIAQYKEHVGDRPGADMRYAPDSTRIARELKWSRVHAVQSSLRDVVEWYKGHQEWWQKIKSTSEFQEYYDKQAKAQWY